jgi:DNA replication protein DnaC
MTSCWRCVRDLQHSRIEQFCDVLKLERIGSQCAREDASHGDFLDRFLGIENDARIERQRDALMKIAMLPSVKTIMEYDFAFASGAPRAQIQELAALSVIERGPRTSYSWARLRGQEPAGGGACL